MELEAISSSNIKSNSSLLELPEELHDYIIKFLDVQSAQALSKTCVLFSHLITKERLYVVPSPQGSTHYETSFRINILEMKCLYIHIQYSKEICLGGSAYYARQPLAAAERGIEFNFQSSRFFEYYRKEITNLVFVDTPRIEYYDVKRFCRNNNLINVTRLDWKYDDGREPFFYYNTIYLALSYPKDLRKSISNEDCYASNSIIGFQTVPEEYGDYWKYYSSILYRDYVKQAKECRDQNFLFITPQHPLWYTHEGCWWPSNLCNCAESQQLYPDPYDYPQELYSNIFYQLRRKRTIMEHYIKNKPKYLAFINFNKIDYICILNFCTYYLLYTPNLIFFGGKNFDRNKFQFFYKGSEA